MAYSALKRRPLGGLSEFKRFLYNAFIAPWRNPKLAYLYVTSLIFSFSFSFMDLFVVIDLMSLPAWDMFVYLMVKSVGVSLFVCILFWMITRFGGKILYPFISAVLSASIMYCIYGPETLSPLELGVIYIFINSPFWAMYHVFFAISISDDNVGNEVSLAGTGLTLGAALGFFFGGFVAGYDLQFAGIMIGFGGMALGTILMMVHAYKLKLKELLEESGALDETLPEAFKRCRYRSLGTFLESIIQIGGGSLWVVFLSLSGIGAAAVGIWNAVMVMIKVIFTPIVGTMINHGQRREMLWGSSVATVGWIPFLLSSPFVLPAMYIWSVGYQLFSSGLNSAWYKSRTVSSLMAREMILGFGRLIFIPLMVWVIYFSTTIFVLFMIIISFLMVIYSLRWMKSIKIKGPVMAIETVVSNR